MIDRKVKLRWRRRIRHSRRQVEDLGYQAEEQLERHFFRRLDRISQVRRFMASWLLLMILLMALSIAQMRSLSSYYQKLEPEAGGTFTEGILGSFTNVNPIYPNTPVDSSLSHLVFSGLFKHNDQGKLQPDLAVSWSVDKTGKTYKVTLRRNVYWQDGLPLTAADVVFTYHLIQNPDAKSPLFSGWRGVKVTSPNSRTVQFTLPTTLSSFVYSLTDGIVPKHVLQSVDPEQLRTSAFNSINPVGSGPFKWDTLQVVNSDKSTREERIGLLPNSDYFLGAPKLQHFIVRAFHSPQALADSLRNKELNSAIGLDSVPEDVSHNQDFHVNSVPLSAEVMVFFKTNNDILSDGRLRTALTLAANRTNIINSLGYPLLVADSPFLSNQFTYSPKYVQIDNHVSKAKNLLNKAGWKVNLADGGIRHKHGKRLSFTLVSESNSEYSRVAQQLQNQWRQVGVDVDVKLQSDGDLQSSLTEHRYDALLYGISLGPDPDVFAYWDSSQASARSENRLNFSEYSSSIADASIEAGRSRLDRKLRIIKYRPFLKAWLADNPALALYQPRLLIVTYGPVYGLNLQLANSAVDRYNNVSNWMIRQARVYK